jgi:hypothetical protein
MQRPATFAFALASMLIGAAAPASAFDFSVVTGANLVFEQADVCTYNEAMLTMRRSDYARIVVELPKGQGAPYRFIVFTPGPQEFIGVSVDASSCALTVIADITLSLPWCEFHPVPAMRCPTEFAQLQ